MVGPPTSTVPTLQLTTCPAVLQVPWLGAAAPGVSPVPSVTESVPPEARAGPLLLSVSWYVRVSPTLAGSGETVPVSARSDRGIVVVKVESPDTARLPQPSRLFTR